jgi:hypothetical protein
MYSETSNPAYYDPSCWSLISQDKRYLHMRIICEFAK